MRGRLSDRWRRGTRPVHTASSTQRGHLKVLMLVIEKLLEIYKDGEIIVF